MTMAARIKFDEVAVGDQIPPLSKVVKREDVKAYADASGDQNPLHQIEVQFRAVVYMDETLVARAEVAAKDEVTRRVRLRVWAEVERAGERVQPIKNSEAEVELA